MKIDRFDEDLAHRKMLPYAPVYRELFLQIREYVQAGIKTIELIHIGSTAIPDLRGKPMLDMVAISTHADLREEQKQFERLGFHRRKVWVDRDDKPYVCGSIRHDGDTYNVNIHICNRGDPVHRNFLTFIAILRWRPDLRRRYEQAKESAHAINPADPEIYNRQKEAVILEIHNANK